jgi:hypothetical protein
MKSWYERYIGIPYTSYNCAGLLKFVWLQEFKINIDINCDFDFNTHYLKREQAMLAQASPFIKIDKPVDKCAVLMHSRHGTIGHVGLYVALGSGYILHAHKDFESSILQPANEVLAINKLYGNYTYE